MKITFICISHQPVADAKGDVGGARVVLVEGGAEQRVPHGARLELFLGVDRMREIVMGGTCVVTIEAT